MPSRTRWFMVKAKVILRNQQNVQYAQDDIKLEIRPGVKSHSFTFLLEIDAISTSSRKEFVALHLKDRFQSLPPLESGKPENFLIESLEFTKAEWVFRVVTQESVKY